MSLFDDWDKIGKDKGKPKDSEGTDNPPETVEAATVEPDTTPTEVSEQEKLPTPTIGLKQETEKQEVQTTLPESIPKTSSYVGETESQGDGDVRPEPEFGVITSLAEEDYHSKDVIMVYGYKGGGKTTFTMNFPGNILCISLDRKSTKIKRAIDKKEGHWDEENDRPKESSRIRVFDLMKYIDVTDMKKYGRAQVIVVEEMMKLLQNWDVAHPEFPVDWVLIDGSEMVQRIAEAIMRWKHNLELEDGIKNRNVWKRRRLVIKQIHTAALNLALRGVLYTAFIDTIEIIKSGQLIDKKEVPKWLDIIMYETDHVLKVFPEGERYFAYLESGKGIASRKRWDITNESVKQVVKEFVDKL